MPVLRDLGAAGIKAWDELGSRETLDAGYEHKGLLTLYSTSASFESAIAGIEALKAYNVEPDEVLDAAQVRQRVPAVQSTVVGGTLAPGDAKVDPMAFTREMARLAAEKGATIMSGTEALGFTLAGRRVASVRTTRGTFEPGTVVLAAGIWSSLLAKGLHVKLPIQAAKGYSVTVARPEGIPEDLPLFLTEGHVCVTPYGGDLRLAGTLEISGINTKILQNRVAGIRQGANEFLTGVATEPLLTWRGLRSLTPDGMPIISRSSAHDNLVVATGHNMNGIKFGPVTGKLVAEIVTGQKLTIDVRPLRLERFH
jgi:D-amino-acid dehydrogenase